MNDHADNLSICNALLDEDEKRGIIEAAILMHRDKTLEAEYARSAGRYSFRYRKEDRESRGLPRDMR